MKARIILLAALLFVSFNVTFAQNDLDSRLREAVNCIDNGLTTQGIRLLEEAVKDYPKDFVANYELAYAYYISEDFENAYARIKKMKKLKNLTDQYYQLKGSMEDEMGKPDEAMATFQKGIKQFPSSGLLYVEMGIMYQKDKNYDQALAMYEKGMTVAPTYPSSYFRAADLLIGSSLPIWGLTYGEMYLLLDPTSARADYLSSRISDFLIKSTTITDTSANISLGKSFNIYMDSESGKMIMPYEVIYTLYADLSAALPVLAHKDSLDIDILIAMHRSLMQHLTGSDGETNTNYSQEIGDPVFPYLQRLEKEGLFDTYCHLLYRDLVPNEWFDNHQSEVEKCISWIHYHPFTMTPENAFNRTTAKGFDMLSLKDKDEE